MSSKTLLSWLLSELLPRYGTIAVPGLGCFECKPIKQFVGSEGGMLLPPSHRFVLCAGGEDTPDIISCARDAGLLGNKKEAKLRSEIRKKVNEIVNIKRSDLGEVGRLFVDRSGDLVLDCNVEAVNRSNTFLPPVQAQPLPVITASGDHAASENRSASDMPASSVKELFRNETVESAWWKGYVMPVLSIVLFTALFLLLLMKLYGAVDHSRVLNELEDNAQVLGDVSGARSDRVDNDGSRMVPEYPLMEKYDGILTVKQYTEGCVIIIGTFGNQRNVDRAVQRVGDSGYIVYTEELESGLTRVGLRFDCVLKDMTVVLNNVKKTLNSDAWLLSPDYNP